MAETIYKALSLLFDGGLADKMSEWMTTLFTAIINLLDSSGGLFSAAMTVFSAIACSLLVLYFFMDLVNQANRDMFSFEKLIVSFVKLLTGFVILLVLQDIVVGLAKIGYSLYNEMLSGSLKDSFTSGSSAGITFTFGDYSDSVFPDWATVETAFTDNYKGFTKLISNIGLFIECSLLNIIGFIAKFAGYFICTSNAILILGRAVFAPIAVVQCFEDGTRSAGIRYLKSFAAECITMACILILIYAATSLTNGLLANSLTESGIGTTITFDNLGKVVSLSNAAQLLVPQLAAIGGMAGAGKLAHDILGA